MAAKIAIDSKIDYRPRARTRDAAHSRFFGREWRRGRTHRLRSAPPSRTFRRSRGSKELNIPEAPALRHEYGGLQCTSRAREFDGQRHRLHSVERFRAPIASSMHKPKDAASSSGERDDASACVFHNVIHALQRWFQIRSRCGGWDLYVRIHARGPVGVEGLLARQS